MDAKTKVFRCDCNWPKHILEIRAEYGVLRIAVVNEPQSFFDKMKSIWAILLQDQYYYAEVIVNRDEVDDFASFVDEAWKYIKLPAA